MGAISSIHDSFWTPIDFEVINNEHDDISVYEHQLFSCVYFKEKRVFLVYFFPSATLKSQETASIDFFISTYESNIKTTAHFTQSQNIFYLQNVSPPLSVSVHTNSHLIRNSNTPFVGIRNMGLTCYINSSLQLLFSCSPFLQFILDSKIRKGEVTYSLQRVFKNLNNSVKPISITAFIHAFGDFFNMVSKEQDAHEFITALFGKIDDEMGKTFTNKRLDILGVVESRVLECEAANIKNIVNETSNEIQVAVAGFDNILDSLRDLTATELLTGPNKWDAGPEYGKQEAKRYVKYKKLPKVLLFHLIRFAYNKATGHVEEIRTFFDCPCEIDMEEFCLPEVDNTKYTLTAVLGHKGDPISGHYVTYAQPKHDGNWYAFNDSVVTRVPFEDVKKTFGGQKSLMTNLLSCIGYGSTISYIVAYVRNDQINFQADIPAIIESNTTDTITVKPVTLESINKQQIKPVTVEKGCTVESIFDEQKEDVNYFISYPGTEELYGPVNPDAICGSILPTGVKLTAYALPKTIGDFPVFFTEGDQIIVKSAADVFETYDKETLMSNHRPVKSVSDIFKGAAISIFSKTLKISFGEKEIEVEPKATYEEMQTLINKDIPERIVLMSNSRPIIPTKNKIALNISKCNNLSFSILPQGATVGAVDKYQHVNITYYDESYNNRNIIVWVKKDSTYGEITEKAKEELQITTGEVTLSSYSQSEILRIHANDDKAKEFRLRCDHTEKQIAYSISSVKNSFKKDKSAFVEVRVSIDENGERKYVTKGFRLIKTTDTGESIAKEVGVLESSSFLLRSANDPYLVTRFAPTEEMSTVFNNTAKRLFNDRPVIIIIQQTKEEKC